MKIKEKFEILKERKEKALIIYLTGGFPTMEESIENIKKVAEGGADIIEIGIPFSDPIADGKIIQNSSNTAISNGATLEKILSSLENLKINIPLVLMSYINPLIAYGKERLFKKLKQINISGLIIPDLPIEESDIWRKFSKQSDIDLIFLTSPTTSDERMKNIAEYSQGFLYCVSVKGITGEREDLPEDLTHYLKKAKESSNIPIAVGFGISTVKQIANLRDKVDGIIIGSRIIKGISEKEDIINLIKKLKKGTRCENDNNNVL
jgi:tryptophan synthase alpha chain